MAPKLRDLSRLPPEYDVTALNKIFKEEHPIAAAILGAGLIEHELETLLRSRFKHQDDETWKTLTDEQGPLHSFYSQIVIGYALGIYDQGMRSDLDIVRRIRNVLAHSKKPIQFGHPLVVKEFSKATRSALPKRYSKFTAQYRYGILCAKLSTKLTRIRFRTTKAKTYQLKRKIKASQDKLKALKASSTKMPLGIDDK